MITFDTLKEYLDYIPNCIICEKPMTFYILGNVRGYYAVNKNYYNKVSMKMIMVDNLLKSKNKDYSLIINPETNKITEGVELVNKLRVNILNCKKKCATCNFDVYSNYKSGNIKNSESFPKINLQSIHVEYMMKNHITVYLSKNRNCYNNIYSVYCSIGGKSMYEFPNSFDFSHFTNLKQLNNRLKTILTFG